MFRFPMQAIRGWSATIAIIAAAFFAVAVPASLSAQDNIKITKHNFSTASRAANGVAALPINTVADYGEICVYCHTPHGGSTTAPLWNRAMGAGPYSMYNSTNSATMNMTVAGTPGAVSLACLSCHDGTIGIDVITNPPNSSSAAALNVTLATMFPTTPGSFKNLGIELKNDHPIGVTFSTAADAAFNTQASITTAGLKFYGTTPDQVECATCHNVHDGSKVPFLRIANTGSALCLTCHIK